jgi:hypothetical protein
MGVFKVAISCVVRWGEVRETLTCFMAVIKFSACSLIIIIEGV